MMRKVLSTIVLVLLVGYVAWAAIAFCNKPVGQVCRGIRLEMQDSVETGYMNTDDVVSILKRNNLDPTGKPLEEVSLRAMEEVLNQSPLIRNSECYKTIGGYVVVEVGCRRPILRVMANGGESYYLDEEGLVIGHIAKAVYVPVATGYITREYAQKKLYALAQYLVNHQFWNAQIDQICVTSRGEIELIPRVGGHVVLLGQPEDYEYKFEKLKTFYEKGLSKVGWNRYASINVGCGNQVIATKK